MKPKQKLRFALLLDVAIEIGPIGRVSPFRTKQAWGRFANLTYGKVGIILQNNQFIVRNDVSILILLQTMRKSL